MKKTVFGTRAWLPTAVLAATAMLATEIHAVAEEGDAASIKHKIKLGFNAAPVPLNMAGKNPDLVGLGSYIVNVQGECNGCHSAGPPTQYAPGGNPYFGQKPEKTNPATYLGGGRNFGPLIPGSADIISRNLTPDKSGKTLGGDSFTQFAETIRTGVDPDKLHPTCSSTSSGPCIPAPFDGSLLQIMPWPAYAKLTNQELRAIYEYLGAIPCVEGGPNQPASRCK